MKKLLLLFICAQTGLCINVCISQWVQYPANTGTVWSYTSSGSYTFAGTDSGIFRTSDNGTVWNLNYSNNYRFLSLASNSSTVFASPHSNKIIYSTNFGNNWLQTSISASGAQCIATNGSNIFAGFLNIGIYRSTDNGAVWTQTSLNNLSVSSLAVKGLRIFAGTYAQGVYYSSDNGNTWMQSLLNNLYVNSLAFKDSVLYAGTVNNGIYCTNNYGLNWVQTGLNSSTVFSLLVKDSVIFAGTYDNGVYISTDNGYTWIQKNQGFYTLNVSVSALHSKDNSIFAGQYNYTPNAGYKCIYRRSFSEIISIKKISSNVTDKYILYQNYPNPFNPATKIKFQINDSKHTALNVYDMLGRKIVSLVNGYMTKGIYEVEFNAEDLPSGIYFYRLVVNNFSETRKLILLK